jgi:hypothetical protein
MNKLFLGVLFTMISFSSISGISKEMIFWKWFEQNQDKLFNFEQNQNEIFKELTIQLHKIDNNLTFEFGPKINNKRDFVISADGIRKSFPSVEFLYNAKPELDKWNIIKFRPKREVVNELNYDNLKLKPEDVYYIIDKDNDKIGLSFYIRNYDGNDNRFLSCVFLFLDEAIGEYDVETKAGFIECYSLETKTKIEKKMLKNLSKDFELKHSQWFN